MNDTSSGPGDPAGTAGEERETEPQISVFLFVPVVWVAAMIIVGALFAPAAAAKLTATGIALTTLSVLLVTPEIFGGQAVLRYERVWLENREATPAEVEALRRTKVNRVLKIGYGLAVLIGLLSASLFGGAGVAHFGSPSHNKAAFVLFALGGVAGTIAALLGGLVKMISDIADLFVRRNAEAQVDVVTLAEVIGEETRERRLVAGAVAFFLGTCLVYVGTVL